MISLEKFNSKNTFFLNYLAGILKLADAHRLPVTASKMPPRQIPSVPTKPLKSILLIFRIKEDLLRASNMVFPSIDHFIYLLLGPYVLCFDAKHLF